MPKASLKNKSLAIMTIPNHWFFISELCKALKEKYNTKNHLYVTSPADKKFLEDTFDKNTYDSITIRNFQNLPHKKEINKQEVLEESRKWERLLDCNMNELIMSNRHYGRGYSLGAYNFPRTEFSEKNDHIQILDIYNDELSFWNNELIDKKIQLFVNPAKVQSSLCEMHNILTRNYSGSYFEDYYYWSKTIFSLNEDYEKNYKLLKDQNFAPLENRDKGSDNYMAYRNKFFEQNGIASFFRRTYYRAKGRAYALKHPGVGKGKYFWDGMKRDYRIVRDVRRLQKGKLITPFDQIIHNPYFYLPLQTEPEWTMQVLSPDFFCQLWAVALCAKATPCDARLTVKEHIFPIGVRPDNFYDQIVAFKNVDMASAALPGLQVMNNSIGVITIKGSTGYEAAMAGKPSIVLASKCDYGFLDHVFHCPKGEGLEDAMRKISQNEVDLEKAEKDGARFAEAIRRSSFRTHGYTSKRRTEVPPKMIEEAVQALNGSL